MAKIAVVIHACGFESEYEICETFKIRIREAKSIAEEIGASMFIITGGVRYQKESKLLLAHYAGIYLKSLFPQNKSPYPILYAIHCYNSSTDTKNVLKICKREEVERIIIVTSEWHSEVVRQMYNYFNDNPNLTVKFAISDKGESAGIKLSLSMLSSTG